MPWRHISAVECIAICGTFALLATGFRSRRGIDYTLRCLSLMVLFFVASLAFLDHLHDRPAPYTPWLAGLLGLVLLTLLTPWRWGPSIRAAVARGRR